MRTIYAWRYKKGSRLEDCEPIYINGSAFWVLLWRVGSWLFGFGCAVEEIALRHVRREGGSGKWG
ncbi:MAG: hypothetical protein KGL39_36845 [Patescibacteria group bacterium]|nr:hypothetical protein [Patescibacteria group bacterium]